MVNYVPITGSFHVLYEKTGEPDARASQGCYFYKSDNNGAHAQKASEKGILSQGLPLIDWLQSSLQKVTPL